LVCGLQVKSKEMLLVATNMPEHEFHFVGNQAGNFELLETFNGDPPNVTVWEKVRCTYVYGSS
jgi:hypothetical protein